MVKCTKCEEVRDKQLDPCFCIKCGNIMMPVIVEKKEKKETDKWQQSTEKTEQ